MHGCVHTYIQLAYARITLSEASNNTILIIHALYGLNLLPTYQTYNNTFLMFFASCYALVLREGEKRVFAVLNSWIYMGINEPAQQKQA